MQKQDATLYVAVDKIHGPIGELNDLEVRFPDIVRETKLVAW